MTALLARHLQVGENDETSSLHASGLVADCSHCKVRHRSLAFTEVHEKQAWYLPPLFTSWCSLVGWAWLVHLPARISFVKTAGGFGSLDIPDLHACPCQGWSTQRTAVHTKLCPCDLAVPGCGWTKHNVRSTEVRTSANRSEVVSETTEQIFACSALKADN